MSPFSCADQLLSRLQNLKLHEPELKPPIGDMRSSAVLVPILDCDRFRLLYTLRSRNLKHHAGQISFPGGVVEESETGWQAALREAEEEIGLDPKAVTPLGRISDVYSPRGFHIQCYVGLVRSEAYKPVLNENEVEQLIEVDLKDLFDEERHSVRPWRERFQVHYFEFGDALVWGVTGRISFNLREAMR